MKRTHIHTLVSFLIFAFCILPIAVSAQGIVPCDGVNVQCNFSSLITLIAGVIGYLFILGVAAATLMFAYAGFLYVTAAGSESNIKKAHQMFWTALLGIIFMASAWFVVNIIVTVLGNQSGVNYLQRLKSGQ